MRMMSNLPHLATFVFVLSSANVGIRTAPGSPTSFLQHLANPAAKARDYAASGDKYFQKKDYKQAITYYEKAINKDSSQGRYYALKGNCYSRLEDQNNALIYYREAVSKTKKDESAEEDLSSWNDTELADMGLELFNREYYDEANWCFKKAILKNPSKPDYYVLKGKCDTKMRKFMAALSNFQEAVIKAGKEDLSVLNESDVAQLGQGLIEWNEPEKAVWCFTEAIKRNPTNNTYYESRGLSYLTLKKIGEAINDFKYILSTDSNTHNMKIRRLLIEALIDTKKLNEAMEETQFLDDVNVAEMAEHYSRRNREAAILLYSKAIRKSPQNPEYRKKRGMLFYEMNGWEAAEYDFQKLLEIDPKHEPTQYYLLKTLFYSKKFEETAAVISTLDTSRILEMGRYYYNSRQYKAAVCFLNEAIERDPHNADNYKLRSDCFEKLEDWTRAMADLQKAVEYSPANEEYRQKLVEILLKSSNFDATSAQTKFLDDAEIAKVGDYLLKKKNNKEAAILWYTKAIEESPLDPEYREKRGAVHLQMENWDKAEEDFRKMMEIDSKNTKGLIYLMDTLFLSKQFKKAAAVIRTMDDDAILKIGKHNIDEQNYEAAIYYCNEAIDRDPTNAMGFHVRAFCFKKLGDFKRAVTDLQQAVDKDSKNDAYRKELFEMLLDSNRFEEASSSLNHFSEADLYEMANAYKNKDEYEKAIVCLNGAIDKNSTLSQYYRERSFCYEKLGKLEEAIANAEQVCEVKHTSEDALHLCHLLVQAKKYDEAKVALKNFEKNYPRSNQDYAHQLRNIIRSAQQVPVY